MKAIEGYKPDGKNKFTSYLSYPFKNAVRELTGVRIHKNEPLNNCQSLDAHLKDDEPNFTLANTIADEDCKPKFSIDFIDDLHFSDSKRR